jgi:hypothetical protein
MSVDVAPEIHIDKPRAEVAAFMFEPRNDALWTSGVVECRPLTDGPLRTGSKVERVSKFLGRKFAYLVEVVDHADARFVEMRVTEPFPMEIRYELEDEAGGTRARIRAKGEATGFFRLAGPLMARMVHRSIANDLALLKECVEGGLETRSAPR